MKISSQFSQVERKAFGLLQNLKKLYRVTLQKLYRTLQNFTETLQNFTETLQKLYRTLQNFTELTVTLQNLQNFTETLPCYM